MASPAASLPPSNSRRIAPGPGLIGFDGGTKRAITMAVQPVNDYVFVQEGDCFGLNCDGSLSVTFANVTPCPFEDSGVISFTGVNDTFITDPGESFDGSCAWSVPAGGCGTVDITDGMGGSTTHDLEFIVVCDAGGLLGVEMFVTPTGGTLFYSGLIPDMTGPNIITCFGANIFSGGTFSIP